MGHGATNVYEVPLRTKMHYIEHTEIFVSIERSFSTRRTIVAFVDLGGMSKTQRPVQSSITAS